MNQYLRKSLFALFAISLGILPSCKPQLVYKKIHGDAQGTTYNITYQGKANRDLQPEIEKLLHEFDMSLSTYEPNSIISRINRNDLSAKPDSYFIEVFQKSLEVYQQSDGAFDITVAPIVNAWGFGPLKSEGIDSSIVDSLLPYIGMNKVRLENGRIFKDDPHISLDVNAIAQGYSVDVVADFLEKKGVQNYMVEIGGELKTKGFNPKKQNWKIGIDKPIENSYIPGENLQAIVEIIDKSVATSGNYRKFYEKDGVKYAHSINPKTGYPVLSNLLSVTVISDDCMTADAWATAFMVMGLEKTLAYLQNQQNLEAYLIYNNEEGIYNTYATPGMEKLIMDEANNQEVKP